MTSKRAKHRHSEALFGIGLAKQFCISLDLNSSSVGVRRVLADSLFHDAGPAKAKLHSFPASSKNVHPYSHSGREFSSFHDFAQLRGFTTTAPNLGPCRISTQRPPVRARGAFLLQNYSAGLSSIER